MLVRIFQTFLICVAIACTSGEEQGREKTQLPEQRHQYVDIDANALPFHEKVYVPIYSEIYHSSGDRRFLLTATLSVRNISMRDSLYVSGVDYYDSYGQKKRTYLEQPILLGPLASVEFVIEDKEDEGGAGANFIVDWAAHKDNLRPVIQAVMIGTSSQQGISFTTEGVRMDSSSYAAF